MHDQADRLRDLVRRSVELHPPIGAGPPIVAVSGGRPGEGATRLACRLGHELARLGRRVVLVDADLTEAHLTRLLLSGRRERPRGTLLDVMLGSRRAVETLMPIDERLQLLCGIVGRQATPSVDAFDGLLNELALLGGTSDLVLADVGSGMSPWADRFWQSAAEVLLVCHQEAASVQAAYRAVKLSSWQCLQHRLRLVVGGEVDSELSLERGHRLAETFREFLALEVRGCSTLASRGDERPSDFPPAFRGESRLARSVRMLAADMLCDGGLGEALPRGLAPC